MMALSLYQSNYIRELEEEIALEGLDGITIDALWARMLDRPSCSIRPTTDQTKAFLWEAVTHMDNVKFYLLPSPRPPVFIFRRLDSMDDVGNFIEPDVPSNCYTYPHFPIEADGNLGSCPFYNQRTDVTMQVRGVSLQFAVEAWGSGLVVVADQKTRLQVLIEPHSNQLCEMNLKQFCFLERVGRSRHHGEVTQGKTGLQSITEDSKTLYYYKKYLSKQKLIKQQVFFLKTFESNRTGLIIHLPKYAAEIKSKFTSDADKVASFVRTFPQKYVLYRTVSEMFGATIDIKKMILRHPKRFQSELIPYRTLYPNAEPKEWRMKNGGEKSVRIFRLKEIDEDEEEEDEEEGDEAGNGFLKFQYRTLGTSIIRQCLDIIETAGPRGLSLADISQIQGISHLHARGLCRYLNKKGICGTASLDKGRQRVVHYFSKNYENSDQNIATEVELEKGRLLKMLSKNVDVNEPPPKKMKVEEDVGPSFYKNIPKEPKVRPSQEDIDAIATQISMSDFVARTNNFNSLIGEYEEGGNLITARLMRRAQLILKAVNAHKVIHDPQKLQRMINEEEELEGHKYTVDRKSVTRILDKLVKDGHVRIMKIKLTGHGREKILNFIVHPSVDSDNSEILSAIDQAKMKLPIITKESIKREARLSLGREKQEVKSGSPLKVFNLGTYDNKAGRKYGLKPKFVKKQVLHSFIFYLVYGHKGQEASREQIEILLTNKKVDLSLMEEMSPVYSTTGDWKTFLPPIPEHKGYKKGWFLVSDLLLRLPLVLFMAMVNVPYEIPGLMEYLNHPIKKYYLVKNIPQDIANTLTIHRKYIFTISELITKLAFMGLVQVGPQKLKEKDQYFVYVNRNATLLDTTSSGSGYNHVSHDITYEAMSYEFKTLEDVEQYWYDLWNFAMNTNLGCRSVMSGKPVVIESVSTKKILIEAITPRGVHEAVAKDTGYLPGDHLGAAGLDSDLFVHLKRNWYWTNDARMEAHSHSKVMAPRKSKVKTPKKRDHSKTANGDAVSSGEIKKIKLVAPAKNKPNDDPEPDETSNAASTSNTEPTSPGSDRERRSPLREVQISKKAKHKKITRLMKPKETKTGRKPYYDQIDREALRRMVKLRVDWSTMEDNLLLICKVASLYMSAETRRHVAKNFCVVREILHSSYPISQNKTSRACQRRMHYMMKNPSTAHSVYLCLEEIKQDPEITDKFGMAVEKMDRLVKAQGKGPKGCQAEYDKIYSDLVKCLLVKLKTITSPDEATLENGSIPDTVDEFRRSYKVVVPKNLNLRYGSFSEVQNIVDIMCSVVNVVIHSSLCSACDKTSYSYQLFYVYQQYPDKLLRSVMARCRSMQIVSCRKRYKRWKTANSGCLPLSSSPYQLSITYINILQTRYQYNIFYECRSALEDLLSKLEIQKQAVSLEAAGSSSSSDNQNLLVDVQVSSGGECAMIVELFSVNFIDIEVHFPQHLIILDPRLSEREESFSLIMKRFKEMLSVINKKTSNEGDEEIEEDDEFVQNKSDAQSENKALPDEFNLSNKSGVANTASRLALYMMRDEPVEYLDKSLQHAHDYFVLKPCKIRVKIDEKKLTDYILDDHKRKDVLNEIKRLAIFPDETTESSDIIEKLADEFDRQVLEPLIYFIETKKEVGALYKDITNKVEGRADEINKCLDALIDSQLILKSGNVNLRFIHNKYRKPWLVRSYYIPRGRRETMQHSSNTNVSLVLHLRDDSDDELLQPDPQQSSKDDGDSNEHEASTSKPTPSAEEGQSTDLSSGRATGKSSEPIVMVLRNKKRRWASLKENKFGEFDFSAMIPIQLSMRPWFRVDGTLNRKVLDRMLGAVLGQCLCTPGMTLKTLQDRFTPVLQPVHTYELVLVLRKIEAVELYVLKRKSKPGLISKRNPITEEVASGYEDAEQVTIQPQLLAVSQLGRFLSDRNSGKDYLDALTNSRMLSFS